VKTIHPHQYVGDGVPDFDGRDRCLFCGLAESRGDVHDITELSTAAAALDARQMGEAEPKEQTA
jgi:hypothetical protein